MAHKGGASRAKLIPEKSTDYSKGIQWDAYEWLASEKKGECCSAWRKSSNPSGIVPGAEGKGIETETGINLIINSRKPQHAIFAKFAAVIERRIIRWRHPYNNHKHPKTDRLLGVLRLSIFRVIVMQITFEFLLFS